MLTITVSLYQPSFFGRRGGGEPDWPPSPRRLLGALLSGAHLLADGPVREAALSALRNLAGAPAPVLDVPANKQLALPDTFAPKTWLPNEQTAKKMVPYLDLRLLSRDTRSLAAKPQDGVALADRTLAFHVDMDADAETVAALDAAAHQVAYFGSSKDKAELSVTAVSSLPPLPGPDHTRLYPRPSASGQTYGWQPNTIDWFDINYERVFGVDPLVNVLPPIPPDGYVTLLRYRPSNEAQTTVVPIEQLPRSYPNHQIPRLMRQLRDLLGGEDCMLRPFPVTVSHLTHPSKPRPSGDGRCIGFGLRDATDDSGQAAETLRWAVASLPPSPHGLLVGPSGAMSSKAWVGPSALWYSTTPLRAFPDERAVAYQISRELAEQFGVEVASLELQRTPLVHGSGRWSEGSLSDGLDQWWARLTLAEPITGPVVLGTATHLGFGTFRTRSTP